MDKSIKYIWIKHIMDKIQPVHNYVLESENNLMHTINLTEIKKLAWNAI